MRYAMMTPHAIRACAPAMIRQTAERSRRPSVDIYENDQAFLVMMNTPGMDADQIQISVESGTLTIQADVTLPTYEGMTALHRELPSRRFVRQFSLPDTIQVEGISASAKNGVLRVTIPKRPQEQPKRIMVASES